MTNKTRPAVFATLVVVGVLASAREGRAEPRYSCSVAATTCPDPDVDILRSGFTFVLQDADSCVTAPAPQVEWTVLKRDELEATATCTTPVPNAAKKSVAYTCTWNKLPSVDVGNWHLEAKFVCGGGKIIKVGREQVGVVNVSRTNVAPGLSFLPTSAWELAISSLHLPLKHAGPGNYYNSEKDVAVLFFDAGGQAYFPIPGVIDEDDDVYVAVVDDKNALNGLEISVGGCNRPPSEGRVYGSFSAAVAGRPVSDGTIVPVPDVGIIVRAIGKCAGAETGGPTVSFRKGTTSTAVTISVNQLYRFAVGVAAAYDGTLERSIDVRPAVGDTVPRVAESSERLGLTSLIYVSLYVAPRDFRKRTLLMWQRLQLFVGLDPRAFDDHLVCGGGYELAPGLNMLVGWRVLTRQLVLAEGSGLVNGSTFDGPAETLPLRERWESGGIFVGVGLSDDLIARMR